MTRESKLKIFSHFTSNYKFLGNSLFVNEGLHTHVCTHTE